MIQVLSALAPIIALIILGHQMRSRGWVDDAFWAPAEWATFHLFLPALLVASLARARLEGLPVGTIFAVEAGLVVVMAATAGLAARRLEQPPWSLDGPAFTSLFQCVIRPNTYVALAVGAGLWGSQGVALIAVCTAAVIPLVNLLSTLAMLHWARTDGRLGWREAVLPVITNPLILSCAVGAAINLSGLRLPPVAASILDILGGASLPLALLAIGAGIRLESLRQPAPSVWLAIAAKMVVLPLLAYGALKAAGLGGAILGACGIYAALPASPASYVTARRMGGDAALVATMLSAQTIAGAVILPLWLMVLGAG
ncbi:AEC family transporter [Paramagnetospirillum magneticum]|uniref:Predicted permease n=1 Tax=Paramagnetospirillum magneticum (strain ATCC 700264 / AMB-1) TaxID=342108 RepID=Q2W9J3_PARM1|nr:AEC family transporter [Paramagnetospirillum magneticum]BAE49482.1 Predicted permease [Paramagnetospirillum magneticum AMB-1]